MRDVLIADRLDCYNNGNEYSKHVTRTWACVELFAALNQRESSFVLTNSKIHENHRIGIWCDYCEY